MNMDCIVLDAEPERGRYLIAAGQDQVLSFVIREIESTFEFAKISSSFAPFMRPPAFVLISKMEKHQPADWPLTSGIVYE